MTKENEHITIQLQNRYVKNA